MHVSYYLTFALFCVSCMAAEAQNTTNTHFTPVPPSEQTAIKGQPVVTWQMFCKNLPNYQPANDVKYRGDVDVHGRRVVGADISGSSPVQLPDEYRMYVTADQANNLNIAIPDAPLQGNTLIGDVTVNIRNGQVSFNGQKISHDQLYKVCSDLQRR